MTDAETDHSTCSPEREEAEIAKLHAETAIATEKARSEKAIADRHELETERAQKMRREEDAANVEHHTVVLDEDVTEKSIHPIIAQLDAWDRMDGDNPQPITLWINSGGGNVFDGLALYDALRRMSGLGHRITTEAEGVAASMAGIILQAGDVRILGANSLVMIHEVQSWAMGASSKIKDEAEFLKRLEAQAIDIFEAGIARAVKSGTATEPYSREHIEKSMDHRIWWVFAREALAGGLVDELR
jgi:ATP-dependent protease ClpP protease subunit